MHYYQHLKSRESGPQPNCVYLLSAKSYGHSGFFKVGVTSNIKDRFNQIKRNVPFEMAVAVIVGDKNPLQLEADFLEKYKYIGIRGEWFYVQPSENIDPTSCSFREYMRDFHNQSSRLEKEMTESLISMSSEGKIDALL